MFCTILRSLVNDLIDTVDVGTSSNHVNYLSYVDLLLFFCILFLLSISQIPLFHYKIFSNEVMEGTHASIKYHIKIQSRRHTTY